MSKSATPTPTQAEALRRAIAAMGRLVYVTGGFWTVDGIELKPLQVGSRILQIPAWSVNRGTVEAMERRGWLAKPGVHRDAPRMVTNAGRDVVKS